MKDYVNFFRKRSKEIKKAELSISAHAMTYKLLLALFPFLMFLMTVAGFLDLEINELLGTIEGLVPAEVVAIVGAFGEQVIGVQMAGLLYASLAIAIASSTSAFRTLVAGINKAYGVTDSRNPIMVWVGSFLLVVIFAVAVLLTMVGLIFRGHIENFLIDADLMVPALAWLYNLLMIVTNIAFVMVAVLVTNYVSLYKKIPVKNILPGSIITVIVWILASYGFSFFVTNFSRMATLYGSVAAVMVLMIWLNIICRVMLFGGAINAMLMKPKEDEISTGGETLQKMLP